MEQGSKGVMVTWEKVSLEKTDFLPNLTLQARGISLQQFLIAFEFGLYQSSVTIVAFDFQEMQWFPVKLSGDPLTYSRDSSICRYDHNTIVLFGSKDGEQETILGLLSFKKDSNGISAYHKMVLLQDRLLKSQHSASIIGTEMYIYGGLTTGSMTSDLSSIDLKTLEITRNYNCSGQNPGKLRYHQSVSVKEKLYIYGGFIYQDDHYIDQNANGARNQSIFILDTATLKWEKIAFGTTSHEIAHVYEDRIYFFGGIENQRNTYVSILNTSGNFWYEVARKGDFPQSRQDLFSAVHENKMIVFGTNNSKSQTSQNYHGEHYQGPFIKESVSQYNLKEIYCLNMNLKPIHDFIGEEFLKKAFLFHQDEQDEKSLEEARKLLKEKKDHDIIFRVQDQQIPAHRDVLSIRSSYFSKMFSSGMQESHQKEIIINEISSKAFEALLKYLYEDALPSGVDILKELIVYSEKTLMKKLRIHCEKTLVNSVTEENTVQLYKISTILGAEDLREASRGFVIRNFDYFADQLDSLSTK